MSQAVIYMNLTSHEDVLMDKVAAEISRLKLIVGRRDYNGKWDDIIRQINNVDDAIQALEDYVTDKINGN